MFERIACDEPGGSSTSDPGLQFWIIWPSHLNRQSGFPMPEHNGVFDISRKCTISPLASATLMHPSVPHRTKSHQIAPILKGH